MKNIRYEEALEQILLRDDRYKEEAYHFMREALDFTLRKLEKPAVGPERHVTGAELMDGIREYALHEFGPMTRTVLSCWGLHHTADFGEVIFNMVENGILGKSDRDSREDFADGYDFAEAFEKPFIPARAGKKSRARALPS